MLFEHAFPVDGEYVIKLRLWRNTFDLMRGMEDPHEIEIAMDGARLTSVTVGGREDFSKMAENPGTFGADLDRRLTVRMPVKAGAHRLWATTVLKSQAPRDDLIKPFLRTTVDGLDIIGDPSVDRMTIEGPFAASGPGDTASRRKILSCRPTSASQETGCAQRILTTLARQAYRKPVDDVTGGVLMDFYRRGRQSGGNFERGIEAALQFILASPEFLFRVEPDPVNGKLRRTPRRADLTCPPQPRRRWKVGLYQSLRRRRCPTSSVSRHSRRACRSSSGAASPTSRCSPLRRAGS